MPDASYLFAFSQIFYKIFDLFYRIPQILY